MKLAARGISKRFPGVRALDAVDMALGDCRGPRRRADPPRGGEAKSGTRRLDNGTKKYRAGVIGLGWMGFLYDLGKRDYERIGGLHETPIYDVESADRPLPDGLDVKRTFHLYDHLGREGLAIERVNAHATTPRGIIK